MGNRMEGRVVIVTGAGRGIGQAIAVASAREDAELSLAARRARELEEGAAQCREHGAGVVMARTDVTDTGRVARLGDAEVER